MKHKSLPASLIVCAVFAAFAPMPAIRAQQPAHTTPSPPPPAPAWDTQPDTWVGADGLNRALPTAVQVGPPRSDRTLGMFYFLTFDRGQSAVYDNTRILTAHPEAIADIHNPAWGPLNGSHYWGEPLFGYYASDDSWVLRKHAAMLANAGVDVVVFDNSNAVTYDRARRALCETWSAIRREGGQTPQIAFLCPFGNPSGIGTATLRELYDTLYAPGRYADLWFRWNGKPLVLADPSYADAEAFRTPGHTPTQLIVGDGSSLGQSFVVDRPFTAAGGEFPTWNTTDAAMTLTLRAGGPGGVILARQRFTDIHDNATLFADSPRPLPAGKYYLEMTEPKGQVGWWGYASSVYEAGEAFADGVPTGGDRALHIRYAVAAPQAVTLVPNPTPMTMEKAQSEARKLRDFFTFRTPIAPYNIAQPPPDQWAWLQIAPQAAQVDDKGRVEEITVGVAQNYNATVNNTAPMSVEGAFGRSWHDGARDTHPDAVRYGFNFAAQWQRALQVDPPFVFVTGWNEWTAGFMDQWVRWQAPPPIFVDEFTEEFSRDIEPMRNRPSPDGTPKGMIDGGHGDDYYYQFVANARRYKGARTLPPVTRQSINIDGGFAQWKIVAPEYRDAVGDSVHRDFSGVTPSLHYRNQTGRHDIVAAKVCYDSTNVAFYVRSKDPMTAPTGDNGMLLLLNTDANYQTGWLGYDYLVNRRVGAKTATLERHVGGASEYRWEPVAEVSCRRAGNEMMIVIPRRLLNLAPGAGKVAGANVGAATIDFKWADNCLSANPTWEDFTLNGDAAPDDRFNYRAQFGE